MKSKNPGLEERVGKLEVKLDSTIKDLDRRITENTNEIMQITKLNSTLHMLYESTERKITRIDKNLEEQRIFLRGSDELGAKGVLMEMKEAIAMLVGREEFQNQSEELNLLKSQISPIIDWVKERMSWDKVVTSPLARSWVLTALFNGSVVGIIFFVLYAIASNTGVLNIVSK